MQNEINLINSPLLKHHREQEQKAQMIEMQVFKSLYQNDFDKHQKKDEILEIESNKLQQILEAKGQWKTLLKGWKKDGNKQQQNDDNYFGFQYNKLLEIFDLNQIIKEAQKNLTKQDQEKDLKEKRLKIQIDKLNELGGIYGLQNFLKTCIKQGLDDTNDYDLKMREKYFGKNEKPQIAIKSVLQIIIEQFQKERLFQLLLIITTINLIIYFDDNVQVYTFYIIMLVIMVLYKGVIKQQYNKEIVQHQNDIKERSKHLIKRCNVLRNGDDSIQIHNSKLVVGDILIFKQGDFIQCDGIITKLQNCNGIEVLQPFPNLFNTQEVKNIDEVKEQNVIHDEQIQPNLGLFDNFIFAGSQIIKGSGQLLVCSVGQKSSDYIQYKQSFLEDTKTEKQRTTYLKQNSMYNPFAFKIESFMNKIGIQCIISLLILLIILLFRNTYLIDITQILLYLSQLSIITIPSQLLQLINLFMIYVIKKCRQRSIYIQDYLSLYWLGQVNEMIIDKIDDKVTMFSKSQINIRYFTQLQLEDAQKIAIQTDLLKEDEVNDKCIEGSFLNSSFEQKNKFMFLSRRLVCPTLDHLKLERIQSSKTLEWLEQQKQKFQFQGIVDQQKLYEEIKNKNIIIGGNADRKEQLINLLKLYDKIIFIKGEENDGKAMEMAHVSIGPHESRSCIKLFNHLEQSDKSYISSMYESLSQGRAVYFYILSYSYALACTSQTIMIFAISSAILSDNIFIMPIPTFIIFYLTLNHFSYQIQKQCNQDVQTYVMHRSPYTKQGRIIDRHTMRKLYKLHSILIVELLIAYYYGYFKSVQDVYIGLLFSKHVFIMVRPIKQVLQQIEGIIYGLLINLINQFITQSNQDYQSISILLRNYSIGLIVVAFNLFVGYR
ncbi:unnamed protein product [Paramecium pentaurelia]|uniref:Cation-transporting P-type ATPase N-terminal domain-containing protein n=1 Tax=Paramecium pentaurelia TaxID=43138 RepID=A0A8S1Y2P2_9CILI|nr:unnamed protein product [Paramecium pentaurelia]